MPGYTHGGYYGSPPAPPPAHQGSHWQNSYDMPSRGPGIPMPPRPTHSRPREFFSRHQTITFSILLWIIFLLIDILAHRFPYYPYSRHNQPRGRILVIVIYTFVFQIIWLFLIGLRTSWDLSKVLRQWSDRVGSGMTKVIGLLFGGLLMVTLVVWPLVALGVNASVAAKASKNDYD